MQDERRRSEQIRVAHQCRAVDARTTIRNENQSQAAALSAGRGRVDLLLEEPCATRHYIVASWGGTGSTNLVSWLRAVTPSGTRVSHVHDVTPPLKLTHLVGGEGVDHNGGYFGTVPVAAAERRRTLVLFIFRDPVASLLSRGLVDIHCRHLQPRHATPGYCHEYGKIEKGFTIDQRVAAYLRHGDGNRYREHWRAYARPAPRDYRLVLLHFSDFFGSFERVRPRLGLPTGTHPPYSTSASGTVAGAEGACPSGASDAARRVKPAPSAALLANLSRAYADLRAEVDACRVGGEGADGHWEPQVVLRMRDNCALLEGGAKVVPMEPASGC